LQQQTTVATLERKKFLDQNWTRQWKSVIVKNHNNFEILENSFQKSKNCIEKLELKISACFKYELKLKILNQYYKQPSNSFQKSKYFLLKNWETRINNMSLSHLTHELITKIWISHCHIPEKKHIYKLVLHGLVFTE
jgi:hypothetical protein